MTWLFRLSIITIVCTYALIILGGITRVTGSGMGCEDDWPLCQGKPYPPADTIAIIEYLHRTVGSVVGLLTIGVAFLAWRHDGLRKRTRYLALVAVVMVIVQGLFGAATVKEELSADLVTTHLGMAMLFLGVMLLLAWFIALDLGEPEWLVQAGQEDGLVFDKRLIVISAIGATMVFFLILTGGATSSSGAALACNQWPLCIDDQLIPDTTSKYTWINLLHRFSAAGVAIALFLVRNLIKKKQGSEAARKLSRFAFELVMVQIIFGAVYVFTDGSDWLSVIHLGTATLLWATMIALVLLARRPAEEPYVASHTADLGMRSTTGLAPGAIMRAQTSDIPPPAMASTGGVAVAAMPVPTPLTLPHIGWRRIPHLVNSYATLTKPGILTLLLATTLAGMMVAAEGLPPFSLIAWTMLGGILSAGGANVLNCYLDRDIDAIMTRTQHRATVTGEVSPQATLAFGIVLTVASVVVFAWQVNWLAAGLALAGSLFYVFVYTYYLKRRTPQNIVIGGAAGAMPPVVGWAAVTGNVSLAAVLMFAIIFFWTPPHFWALALLKQDDYGRAAVPMLPVVAGEGETRRQMLIYTLLLAVICLLLAPMGLSWIYLVAAVALNTVFIGFAWVLFTKPGALVARRMFFYSLWYLFLMFGAMVVDRLVLA